MYSLESCMTSEGDSEPHWECTNTSSARRHCPGLFKLCPSKGRGAIDECRVGWSRM